MADSPGARVSKPALPQTSSLPTCFKRRNDKRHDLCTALSPIGHAYGSVYCTERDKMGRFLNLKNLAPCARGTYDDTLRLVPFFESSPWSEMRIDFDDHEPL